MSVEHYDAQAVLTLVEALRASFDAGKFDTLTADELGDMLRVMDNAADTMNRKTRRLYTLISRAVLDAKHERDEDRRAWEHELLALLAVELCASAPLTRAREREHDPPRHRVVTSPRIAHGPPRPALRQACGRARVLTRKDDGP